MTIYFENAVIEQLPRIVEIYNQTIAGRMVTADLAPVTVESRLSWFQDFNPETRPLWVIKREQQVAGWVGLESFYGRPAYRRTVEISLYIDRQFRHQGIGQQTLDYVRDQLPRLGIDAIVAYVFSHNFPSQHLFQKNGFEIWGHLPDVALMDGQRRSLDILGRHF